MACVVPTNLLIHFPFILFIYFFLLIKQQIPYRVEKEAWTKAGQSQTAEREADAGKSRETQRNLQKGTSFMYHINVTDFLLLTGKIHFFKEHCWQLIFLLCTVHALSEYHCLKWFVRSGMRWGFMFALMILVGISDLRVCCVCTMYLPTVIWVCWWNHVTLIYVFNQYLWQVEDSVCCVV